MESDRTAAVREGRAYADLSDWRKVLVRGSDARDWLNDLLTAEIGTLSAGTSRPALLLSPTGRIRAMVTVGSMGTGLLLLQDPHQPSAIDALLAPYVLSSDVEMIDSGRSIRVLAFPDGNPPDVPGAESIRPSSLGPGADLVLSREVTPPSLEGLTEVGPESVEEWRIRRGIPRFPADLTPDSLPHEADLDAAIDYGKGCYLGQEAVAKVRNLGHPPWVVLKMRAEGAAAAGDVVVADGRDVGTVTSAAGVDGYTAVIARVRWAARDLDLRTASGAPLRSRGLASSTA
jgi:tRNA-modifying protein YgfZ